MSKKFLVKLISIAVTLGILINYDSEIIKTGNKYLQKAKEVVEKYNKKIEEQNEIIEESGEF